MSPGMPKVSEEEVRAELERMLSSADLRASKRLRAFLRFVVEETLAGHAATIKSYTIAVTVFGRGDDFDPRVDPIVSVEAGRLRRAMERYYLLNGRFDPVRIEIPKGKFVPTFAKQEAANRDPRPATRAESGGRPGVAVVVFGSLADAHRDDSYPTGLSAQLVANLARQSDFRVIGPLLPERRDGTHPDVQSLGRQYDVQYVLTGTVRRSEESIRVIANLIEVESAANAWVRQFDHDLTVASLYETEDAITREVAATLADQTGIITRLLVEKARRKTCRELTSYEAALKMYHWGLVLTDKAFEDAWQSLQQAVQREPDFALTKALLADIFASDYLSEIGLVSNRLATAEALAREAVELDPECQDARWVMGFVHFLRRRPEYFVEEFEAALTLNPQSAMVMAIYGLFLPGLGRWDEAVRLIEAARQLNPRIGPQYHIPACLNHYRRGDYEQAYSESLHFRMPRLLWEPLIRAAILGQLGRTNEARVALQNLLDIQPGFPANGRDIVRRLLYSDENVEMVFEGLHKAGLPGEAETSGATESLGRA